MQDRFLFRGKRVATGEWEQGYLSKGRYYGYKENSLQFCIDQEESGVMITLVVGPGTIGQCTGLRDKNGTLVFEGDIVKCVIDENEDELEIYCVAYENYSWELQNDYYDNEMLENFVNDYTTLEIIGNIYDNQELLQERDNSAE